MKIAALDLGSNTFLLLICEVQNYKQGSLPRLTKIDEDRVGMVRLGEGVHKFRKFSPQALKRAESTLKQFYQIISQNKPERILAMATSAARDVQNAQDLIRIGEKLGIPIEIISGETEAQVTYQGVLSGVENSDLLIPSNSNGTTHESRRKMHYSIVDIGGGSTEIILGEGSLFKQGFSLNCGCVRLTELFFQENSIRPPNQKEIGLLEEYVEKSLEEIPKSFLKENINYSDSILSPSSNNHCKVIACSGTPMELVRIMEISNSNQSSNMKPSPSRQLIEIEALEEISKRLTQMSPHEIQSQFGTPSGRSDVITAGSLILKIIAKSMKWKTIETSSRGIRHGIAIESFLRLILFLWFSALTLSLNAIAIAKTSASPISTIQELQKKTLQIGKASLIVEIADTPETTSKGLMFRTKLKNNQGMLFVFPDEDYRLFWMKNTFIPLSVGFFDAEKTLTEIQDMNPVTSEMQIQIDKYPSKNKSKYALEVNKGWFFKNNIKIGSKFRITSKHFQDLRRRKI